MSTPSPCACVSVSARERPLYSISQSKINAIKCFFRECLARSVLCAIHSSMLRRQFISTVRFFFLRLNISFSGVCATSIEYLISFTYRTFLHADYVFAHYSHHQQQAAALAVRAAASNMCGKRANWSKRANSDWRTGVEMWWPNTDIYVIYLGPSAVCATLYSLHQPTVIGRCDHK